MAQLLVRNLDDDVKMALKARAQRHGRSMEEEARSILRAAVLVAEAEATGLGSRIAARFADIGLDDGVPELRGEAVRPAVFDPAS